MPPDRYSPAWRRQRTAPLVSEDDIFVGLDLDELAPPRAGSGPHVPAITDGPPSFGTVQLARLREQQTRTFPTQAHGHAGPMVAMIKCIRPEVAPSDVRLPSRIACGLLQLREKKDEQNDIGRHRQAASQPGPAGLGTETAADQGGGVHIIGRLPHLDVDFLSSSTDKPWCVDHDDGRDPHHSPLPPSLVETAHGQMPLFDPSAAAAAAGVQRARFVIELDKTLCAHLPAADRKVLQLGEMAACVVDANKMKDAGYDFGYGADDQMGKLLNMLFSTRGISRFSGTTTGADGALAIRETNLSRFLIINDIVLDEDLDNTGLHMLLAYHLASNPSAPAGSAPIDALVLPAYQCVPGGEPGFKCRSGAAASLRVDHLRPYRRAYWARMGLQEWIYGPSTCTGNDAPCVLGMCLDVLDRRQAVRQVLPHFFSPTARDIDTGVQAEGDASDGARQPRVRFADEPDRHLQRHRAFLGGGAPNPFLVDPDLPSPFRRAAAMRPVQPPSGPLTPFSSRQATKIRPEPAYHPAGGADSPAPAYDVRDHVRAMYGSVVPLSRALTIRTRSAMNGASTPIRKLHRPKMEEDDMAALAKVFGLKLGPIELPVEENKDQERHHEAVGAGKGDQAPAQKWVDDDKENRPPRGLSDQNQGKGKGKARVVRLAEHAHVRMFEPKPRKQRDKVMGERPQGQPGPSRTSDVFGGTASSSSSRTTETHAGTALNAAASAARAPNSPPRRLLPPSSVIDNMSTPEYRRFFQTIVDYRLDGGTPVPAGHGQSNAFSGTAAAAIDDAPTRNPGHASVLATAQASSMGTVANPIPFDDSSSESESDLNSSDSDSDSRSEWGVFPRLRTTLPPSFSRLRNMYVDSESDSSSDSGLDLAFAGDICPRIDRSLSGRTAVTAMPAVRSTATAAARIAAAPPTRIPYPTAAVTNRSERLASSRQAIPRATSATGPSRATAPRAAPIARTVPGSATAHSGATRRSARLQGLRI